MTVSRAHALRVKRPFSLKLFGIVALFCVVLSGWLFEHIQTLSEQEFRQVTLNTTRLLLLNHQDQLEYLLRRKDTDRVQKMLGALGASQAMRHAMLLDSKGRVMASLQRAMLRQDFLQTLEQDASDQVRLRLEQVRLSQKALLWFSEDKGTLYALAPVILQRIPETSLRDTDVGMLYFELDLDWHYQHVWEHTQATLLPMVLVLILSSLGLAAIIHVLISGRIAHIARAVTHFSTDREPEPVDTSGNDELALVGDAINRMMRRVREQHLALSASEAYLSLILDNMGDAVISTDVNGRVVRMNATAEALSGWLQQEASGRPVDEVLCLRQGASSLDVGRLIRVGERLALRQGVTVRARQGRLSDVAGLITPLQDGGPQHNGGMLILENISEKRRLAILLEEIALGVSGAAGQSFFNSLVDKLHELFQCDCVFVATNDPERATCVTTLALCIQGESQPPLCFDLAGTACEPLLAGQVALQDSDAGDESLMPVVLPGLDRAFRGFVGVPLCDETQKPLGAIVLLHASPIEDTGQIKTTLDIFASRAVSEIRRERAYSELLRVQQKLALHLHNTPVAVIECDEHMRIVDWNPAATKVFGFGWEEVFAHQLHELLLPETDHECLIEFVQRIKDSRQGKSCRLRNITNRGDTVYCEWYSTPLIDADGAVSGIASLVMDITAEETAMKAITDKEREQRDILSCIIDAVITIDEAGIIQTFNPAAEEQMGYSAGDVIGKNVNMLMPEPHASGHDRYLRNYVTSGEAKIIGTGRDVQVKRKDGSEYWARLSVVELPIDPAGNRRFMGTLQDLTQVRAQQERLRRSQKMDSLGKLTSGIAHDFNNILGIIIGYADMLNTKLSDQPGVHRYLEQIRKASDRGATLTNKLLTFSRTKKAESRVVNANTVIQELQPVFEKSLTARHQLRLETDPGLWLCRVDANDFEDVLLNLVINASHAMPDSGECRITTENCQVNATQSGMLQVPAGDYVLVSVADTGCGIDPATVEKIFDPFFTTKGDQGTGLGLSQVYGFVRRSDGAVQVRSELDKGTVMQLYLPRYQGAEDPFAQIDSRSTESVAGTGVVLVVDDEEALRELAVEVLMDAGYQVYSADNGRAALDILAKHHVDLVFSDIVMPHMDGYELAQEVQTRYPDIKVQLASGYAQAKQARAHEIYPVGDILFKPYSTRDLLDRVAKKMR